MSHRWCWLLVVCGSALVSPTASDPAPEPHRSPIDVAVLPDGTCALTANHTANTVSLVDLTAGKVLSELPCGTKPAGVACTRDGRRAAVSNLWSGTVTLLDVGEKTLRAVREVAVGPQPRGVVFAPDGHTLYVAVAGADAVVQVDWATGKTLQRWAAPREPRRLLLSRDGHHLVAASTRSAEVRCWDTRTGKLAWERALNDSFNLLGLTFTPDEREVITAQVFHRHHPMVRSNIENGWAVDNRLARIAAKPDKPTHYGQIALDLRRKAVGDPSAVAFTPKGDFLLVVAAGSQELLALKADAVAWVDGEPGDFLDGSLSIEDNKFRRIPLGGRPLAIHVIDGKRAVVANYLLDALQVVDLESGKVTKIALGGPAKPSLARQGEAIFYDARRSHHQWFSCHTCHTDGHTNGRLFDTLNDDSTNTPKMTPTLRGVAKTAPYTWHGWQDKLTDAVEKSLTETLWTEVKPTRSEIDALTAFLGTLEQPPNPHLVKGKLSAAAERGKAVFEGKARCARCHQGETFTSKHNYDVKLPPDGSPFDKWNPPSLRGVHDRGPYLHDGSVETLDDLLRGPHAPEKLDAKELTADERRDLIEYLRSL